MIIIVALVAAFAVLRRLAQERGSKLLAELASCDFCLCWWICLFASLVINELSVESVLVAVCATPIARYIL